MIAMFVLAHGLFVFKALHFYSTAPSVRQGILRVAQ